MTNRIAASLGLAALLALAAAGALAGGASAATLAIEPARLDFGDRSEGASATRSLTVTNPGPTPAVIDEVAIVGDVGPFDLAGGSCGIGLELAPGGACAVTISFRAPGGAMTTHEASLLVFDAGAEEPAVARLSARSSSPPRVVAEPETVDFGGVVVGAPGSVRALRLRNVGGRAAVLERLPFRGGGPFAVGDGCVGQLAAGAACELELTFRPSRSDASREGPLLTSRLVYWVRDAWAATGVRTGTRESRIQLRGTALSPDGRPFPTAEERARTIESLLAHAATTVPRAVRGGPRRRLSLPPLAIESSGWLNLWVYVVRRPGARTLVAHGGVSGARPEARLRYALDRSGRRLLSGPRRRRIEVVFKLKSVELPRLVSVRRRFTVRPPTTKRKAARPERRSVERPALGRRG